MQWPIGAQHNSISVLKHNNLLDNVTIFFRTQQSFREHNNLVQNTTIFSRTQQSIREHNNLFQNTRKFPDAQQYFPKRNKIFRYTNTNQNKTKLSETQQNLKALVTNPDTESNRSLGLALVTWAVCCPPSCCPPYAC